MNYHLLKKNIALLISFLFVISQIVTTPKYIYAADAPTGLYAQYASLIDADSGRVLFEKNGYTKAANASTTKILTCLVALELAELDDVIEVSSYAASMPDVQLNIVKNDKYVLRDLLYSLMLQSHNDSAVAIAEGIAAKYLSQSMQVTPIENRNKDESKQLVSLFVNKMNERAKGIGCENTHFITPNGLDATDEFDFHGTTAVDLAHIMAECIKNEKFISITQTQSHSFSNISGTKHHVVNNTNAFLSMMDGIISGKTGFTNKAGYCYVCAYKEGERTFVSVVLACGWPNNKTYKWKDSKKVLEYAKSTFFPKEIFMPSKSLQEIPVHNGIEESIDTHTLDSIKTLIKDSDVINVVYELPQYLDAPIKKDETIGYAKIYINDMLCYTVPIYSNNMINAWTFRYCLNLIINNYTI